MKETAERKQRNLVKNQAHQLFIRREREDLRYFLNFHGNY